MKTNKYWYIKHKTNTNFSTKLEKKRTKILTIISYISSTSDKTVKYWKFHTPFMHNTFPSATALITFWNNVCIF